MGDVLVRNMSNGAYEAQSLANAGAIAASAAGGLAIAAGEIGFDATVAGKGLTNTNGILAVAIPGRGAKVAISTAGNGTLTAAGIVGGLIMRTGPTGAYSDTTDTAANIIAALDDPAVGDSWEFSLVNGVAFADTIVAGVGVTLAGTTAVTASLVRRFHVEVTGAATVTITGIGEMTA